MTALRSPGTMDFLFRNKVSASLDIGAYGVKWAAIDKKKGYCYVWNADLFPERQSRKDVQEEEALTQRLVGLMAECQKAVPVWNKNVVGSVYGNKVFYGYLEFPRTTAKLLKYCVTSALLNSLPYPLDELEVMTAQVDPLSGRSDKSAAFYGLVHVSHMERLRKRLEACGLKLEQACLVPVALARSWGRNRGVDADGFVALVNIGFDKTMVVVARDEHPYYVREFTQAGAQFTHDFQVGEQVSWEVAEKDKRAYQVFSSREPFIEPDLRKWLEEVKRSVGHFESKYSELSHKIKRIVLSGGGACWPSLDKRTEEHLSLPVLVDGWSQIHPLEPRSEDEALLHKVSIGSALR